MNYPHFSPRTWLALSLAVAGLILLLVVTLAARQPGLGLSLRWQAGADGAVVIASHGPAAAIPAGTVLVAATAGGDYLAFESSDFVAEPASGLQTLGEYDRFLERQERLSRLQAQPSLTFIDTHGHPHALQPAPHRSVAALPVEFWVQLAVGFFAWLIASGVWIFRQQEASARYLLLSGFSTLLFAPLAAVYSTRELALPGEQFRWLCDINFLGGCLYSATVVAVLWYYPRRLGRLPLGPLLVATYLGWWLLQELRLVDSMLLGRRSLVFVALLATFALGIVQWRRTRRDPVARAALKWFLLAWLVGTSLFSALIFVPQIFGVRTDHLQGYAFLLFLLVYGGLAFGILRFRLFDLGEWWFRVLLWVMGAGLFVALDLFLLLMLNINAGLSLSLALLICGFLWLPLRGWLWHRLVEKPRPAREELFRRVLDISLAVSAEERAQRWQQLLKTLFDPLQYNPAPAELRSVQLADDGLCLLLPGHGQTPALRLGYPDGGSRLFTPRDCTLATELLDMLQYADRGRDAYNQGVREERHRIARDLHDDIGARLLSGLHQDDIGTTRQTIQQAITEMRTIINGLTGTRMQLAIVLAELRHETALRVEAAGLELDWPIPSGADHILLSYRSYRHYLSMLREITSNVLRHAGATRLRVLIHCADGELHTHIEDNGTGMDTDSNHHGRGLGNLQQRLGELQGRIELESSPQGTRLRLAIPLPAISHGETMEVT